MSKTLTTYMANRNTRGDREMRIKKLANIGLNFDQAMEANKTRRVRIEKCNWWFDVGEAIQWRDNKEFYREEIKSTWEMDEPLADAWALIPNQSQSKPIAGSRFITIFDSLDEAQDANHTLHDGLAMLVKITERRSKFVQPNVCFHPRKSQL